MLVIADSFDPGLLDVGSDRGNGRARTVVAGISGQWDRRVCVEPRAKDAGVTLLIDTFENVAPEPAIGPMPCSVPRLRV